MSPRETVSLSWGCNKALPDGLRAAWGGRLIAPDDLPHDRQGATAVEGYGPVAKLLDWLNGGVWRTARENLAEVYGSAALNGASGEVVTLYQDDLGIVVASAQASHGHVYVSAWLREDDPADAEQAMLRDLTIGDEFAMDDRVWRVFVKNPSGLIGARDAQFSTVREFYDPATASKAGEFSTDAKVSVIRRAAA